MRELEAELTLHFDQLMAAVAGYRQTISWRPSQRTLDSLGLVEWKLGEEKPPCPPLLARRGIP